MSPSSVDPRGYMVGMFSGAITLLLGISFIYGGTVILSEPRKKSLKELGGFLCLALGAPMYIVGFFWFLFSGAGLAIFGIV